MPERQHFLNLILDHAEQPRNYGVLENADVMIMGGNGECGDSITVYLKTDGAQRIVRATFEAEANSIGRAAASLTTEAITGKTLGEVAELPHDTIINLMGREVIADRMRSVTLVLDLTRAAARKLLGSRK